MQFYNCMQIDNHMHTQVLLAVHVQTSMHASNECLYAGYFVGRAQLGFLIYIYACKKIRKSFPTTYIANFFQ